MEVILIIGSAIVINVIVGVWLSKYRIAGKQVANPYQADCQHIQRYDWEGAREPGWFCDRCGKGLDRVELALIWKRQKRETQERIERTRERMEAWERDRNAL